jgi:hypothetical protein
MIVKFFKKLAGAVVTTSFFILLILQPTIHTLLLQLIQQMTLYLSLRLPEDLRPWADESQFAYIFWNLRVKDILIAKETRNLLQQNNDVFLRRRGTKPGVRTRSLAWKIC